jgi:hypothetical protein
MSTYNRTGLINSTISQDTRGDLHVTGELHDKTKDGAARSYRFKGGFKKGKGPWSQPSSADPRNKRSFDDRDEGPTIRSLNGFAPGRRQDLTRRLNLLITTIHQEFLADVEFLEASFNSSSDVVEVSPSGKTGRTFESRRVEAYVITRTTLNGTAIFWAKYTG